MFYILVLFSEEATDGTYSSEKVDQILLNGNGIVMVRIGASHIF